MPRKSDFEEEKTDRPKARSNYFQTEFTVCVKKGREADKKTTNGASYDEDKRKVSISIQTGNRSGTVNDETPKERKKWVRPPLVGQASSGSDSQISVVPAHDEDDDSEIDVVNSSQEPFVHSTDYPNRKDYISEKPPEGSSIDNRVPSPASASSLTSGRPLEWDSGADVGYFQAFAGADKLSSLELMALGGSASLLTRSDPEGTVSTSAVLPPPPPIPPVAPSSFHLSSNLNQTHNGLATASRIIGAPNAESTPNIPSSKSSTRTSSLHHSAPVVSHLFPEVIIERCQKTLDSDDELQSLHEETPKTNEVPKRSSSLEDMATPNQPLTSSVRSHSQNNVNFDMNAHLLKIVQPPSNSSSSLATVVKGSAAAHCEKNDSESGSGVDGRANSFEYLPGTAFKQNQESSSSDDALKIDVQRGVRLLSNFMKGTNANNTILKKKLLKNVVDELLAKKYAGDEEWSSTSSQALSSKWMQENESIPDPPSTWQGAMSIPEGAERPSRTWPVTSNARCATRRAQCIVQERSEVSGESESQASLLARMDNVGKPEGASGSTLESSSVAESSIKEYKQPLPAAKKRTVAPVYSKKDQSGPSSSSSTPNGEGRVPTTVNSHERRKLKGEVNLIDPGILKYLHCERENQLEWIKKEIDHLSNLKRLLEMHESLRKNFDSLKKMNDHKEKNVQRLLSNSHSARPRRRPTTSKSEPLRTSKLASTNTTSECGWDSHDYGVSTKGILRKNASTNTFSPDDEIQQGKSNGQRLHKPISYTIVFDCKGKENVQVPPKEPNFDGNDSNRLGTVGIANRDTLKKESRERILAQYNINLQNELLNKKPDYVCRAELRRQTVAELAAMREIREKNRKKILVAAVNGEEPPPLPNPLAVKRVVSQKSMRKLTEKNYKKSSIVKQQQLEKRKKEESVTNRLMAEMFNRNLQKRILRGETYLSNSVNVL